MPNPEETKKDGGKPEEDAGLELEEIKKKCLDSEGYIIFCGILTPEKDKNGNKKISFIYRRFHFSFEDSAKAAKHLRLHVENDYKGRM